jgi:regulator of protease activity HflC (stomatin/prohibitin superfamily)
MSVLLAVLLSLGAGLAIASLRRVPEDTVCTVHRFGRYVRTLTPGLRFTLPLVDRIAHRVRLVGHQIALPPQPVAGGKAGGALYYQILEPERAGDLLDDVDALVAREAHQQLAVIAGGGSETATHAQQLTSGLNQRLAWLGLRVIRCQLELTPA